MVLLCLRQEIAKVILIALQQDVKKAFAPIMSWIPIVTVLKYRLQELKPVDA
jgi:hypothetical protein